MSGQQNGFADAAQAGQNHIFQNALLLQQTVEFFAFLLAPGQIRGLMRSARGVGIGLICNHFSYHTQINTKTQATLNLVNSLNNY